MNDLREALDREAGRVRADLGALDQVMRRADKHHRNRRITAGAVALVVVVAGFAGLVGALGGTRGSGVASPGGEWRALWPQQSQAEAEIAQERANGNDDRLTWQRDVTDFLWQFGNDGLNWALTEFPAIPEPAARSGGPLTVTFTGAPWDDCQHDNEWTCPDDAFREARVTVERLLQSDERGIWFVTDVVIDGKRPELENSPLPPVDTPQPGEPPSATTQPSATAAAELPSDVEDFVGAFMDSRLSGSDFARDRVSAEAATAYHAGEGGLALYGYTREPGARWEIYGWNVLPNTDRWRVVVRISGTGGDFPESGTIHETLLVGSPGDGRPYQVLSAERSE